LREAEPVAGLLALVKRTRASLVVLATHGRGGASRLFLGSVAEAVVRQAASPVLVLKLKK
jgi:nucleotide-binding universal stress UspA family protein